MLLKLTFFPLNINPKTELNTNFILNISVPQVTQEIKLPEFFIFWHQTNAIAYDTADQALQDTQQTLWSGYHRTP